MGSGKVTVYITNYNYGEYIEQSIQSILDQTYKNFELLIIDDGSTDDSKNVIEKFRDINNVRIIYQKTKVSILLTILPCVLQRAIIW